jgi:hypothetical protein
VTDRPPEGVACVYIWGDSPIPCPVCVIAWVASDGWGGMGCPGCGVPTLSACGCVLELWLSRLLASLGRVKLGATYCHEGIAICVGRSTVRGSG